MFLHIQLDFMDNLILLFFVSSILYSYNLFFLSLGCLNLILLTEKKSFTSETRTILTDSLVHVKFY